jgi:hypothetical protein
MIECRYEAFRDIEGPTGGPLLDAFNAILNIFGDCAAKRDDGSCPGSLPYPFLASRMSCELGLTPAQAKKRLRSLIDGEYLVERYGQVHFPIPKQLMIETAEETEEGWLP